MHGWHPNPFPIYIRVLTQPPINPRDTAEIAELLRMCVHDTIRVETLQAHTAGAIQEVDMEQSTSKRAREDDEEDVAYDTSDTGISRLHPQVAHAGENLGTSGAPQCTPSHEREGACLVFLAQPFLPEPA